MHPQPDPVGTEQREQRHCDGAELHRAEHGDIERARRLEHHRDAIAGHHALRGEPVRELRRLARDVGVGQLLVGPAACARMIATRPACAVDALVRDVEALARAVEELPQLVGESAPGRRHSSCRP